MVAICTPEAYDAWSHAIFSQVRDRFEKAGGRVYEFAAAEGVKVHPNGVSLVMPEGASRNSSTGNGASASGNSFTGAR